jgi:hypothetical protein
VLIETGQQRVKITDFGLARAADDASISQSGIIAGTPMYMAPEQAKGEKLDQRADLFSLGSVLYQMAAGRPPFRADGTVAVLKRVAEDTPRAIREIIPETPQWLCDIISKLHAKNPDDRYQSAREVADVLADCEAQLKANSKLKDFSRIPSRKPATRGVSRWGWAAAIALILVGAATVALTWWHQQSDREPPSGAKQEPPAPVAKQEPTPGAGWVQLFNGKDLTGWKTHPAAAENGDWTVQGGIIVGRSRGPTAFLFSETGTFENFHLRAEVQINGSGDSGIFCRAPFDVRGHDRPSKVFLNGGYEVQIAVRSNWYVHTGSLADSGRDDLQLAPQMSHRPDAWFVLEVIADGNHFVTRVDGRVTADYRDEQRRYTRGHLALQAWGNDITVAQFRKIEIRELPPSVSQLGPAFKNSIGMEFVSVPKASRG